MAVGLDHPLVADYLRRFDSAALALPPNRRAELAAELRAHAADALQASGQDEATVRAVLDRLGDPEEIVRDELAATSEAPYNAMFYSPSGMPGNAAPPNAMQSNPMQPNAMQMVAPANRWGALEVIAVLSLTVGAFILPIVGPMIGVVCAWTSERWTRREKVIATIWGALAPMLMMVLIVVIGSAWFAVEAHQVMDESVPAQSAPADPLPLDVTSPDGMTDEMPMIEEGSK